MKKNKNDVDTSKMIHVRLPGDLHKELRKLVIDKDTSIQEWVSNLVESKLQKELN